jgi:primosomal protein N' (replication factor Y)
MPHTPTLPGLAPPAVTGAEAVLVQVAVLAPIHTALTYLVPPNTPVPLPGTRVLVPLGTREVTGVVMPLPPPSGGVLENIRPLTEVLDREPLWSADLLETVRFCAEYYVARAALPPGLAPKSSRQWMLTEVGRLALEAPDVAGVQPQDLPILQALLEKPRTPLWLQKALGVSTGRLARLGARGLLMDMQELEGRGQAATVTSWSALQGPTLLPLPPRAPAVAAVDAFLRSRPAAVPQAELAALFPQAVRHLKKLASLHRVASTETPAAVEDPYAAFPTPRAPGNDALTSEQRTAIGALTAAMDERVFRPFLLEGVTGSGKTEVYLQALSHVRAQGRTALILVPEIALTPSLAARFRGRVPGGVAVLHSGLTQSQRLAAYDAARSGRVGAILGARSAVFAPLWNLGLLVVDEEHDGSYKQDETPRYQGRDLALFRARAAGAVCVLGSATPSLESVHGAQTGRLHHLRLTQRPLARPLPTVELVDLRKKSRTASPSAKTNREIPLTLGARVPILSTPLRDALVATLEAHQQALIFLNRRGYSSAVLCPDCGVAVSCPNCAVALTHHAPRGVSQDVDDRPLGHMRCHYCNHQQPIPESCPSCNSIALFPMGLGIQRVEAELTAQFPNARIGRLDRDAVRHKGSLEKVLQQFSSGGLDILVGTQMLAKGHDYPGVTLVGVVAADLSLRMPDWRAAERTLQILTQVAGRAGRGDVPGRVLIQTYCPDHEALQCAARHDVHSFSVGELALRQQLRYPPFSRLCLVRTESKDQQLATNLAQNAARVMLEAARPLGPDVEVLGPAPAPLARLKEVWRFQVFLKAATHAQRSTVIHALQRKLPSVPANARLVLDVDPGSVL